MTRTDLVLLISPENTNALIMWICAVAFLGTSVVGETVTAPSVVRAEREAILSSQTAGRITSLPVEEGGGFRAGEVISEIDCTLLEFEAAAAAAENLSKTAIARSRETLFSRGGSGQLDVDAARADAAAATARSNAARARLEYCKIEAPYDGRLVKKLVNTYELVEPGTALLSIVSTGRPTLEIIAPAEWLEWAMPGVSGMLQVEATRTNIGVEITGIAPIVDPVSRTVTLSAQFTDELKGVLPGMSGLVTFEVPK